MMKNINRIIVPSEERTMIDPVTRQRLFTEIYKTYSKMYRIQLIYAYLNTDPNLNAIDPTVLIDYLIIYKARNDANTTDLILYDAPPIFSDRCVPAYRYYKKVRKKDNFYRFGIDEMVILQKNRFYEFLATSPRLKLTRNKKDGEKYWKHPKNGVKLAKALSELGMQYNKKM